jgi:nicotinate-nucleotide pyrophosphorylase
MLVPRVPQGTQAVATFLAKDNGILAGLAVADEVMRPTP